MTDIVSIEDAPGGKKSHFIIHLNGKQLHLKSDDFSLKQKWLSTLTQLYNHYQRTAKKPSAGTSSYKAEEADLQVRHEIFEDQEGMNI
jgi:hypothetical protein